MTYENLFKGLLKPVQRKPSKPPIYTEVLTIGKAGKYFTNIKVWVREATKEYPSYGIFLSCNNGNSSTFSKLENTTELQHLVEFFTRVGADIQAMLPNLEEQQEQVSNALAAYEQQINNQELINQLVHMSHNDDNSNEPEDMY